MKKSICGSGKDMCNGGGMGYFLGVIGAAVYFIGSATTFWMGVLGLLKALVFPVFLVYYLFGSLLK